MMKTKRITLSMAAKLHAQAVKHAREIHYTDFSGYVTKLIVADVEAHREKPPSANGGDTLLGKSKAA